MREIVHIIEEHLTKAFQQAGYDAGYAKASLSNRPDLCEYQCNGAMAAAKRYHKAPIAIASDIAGHLQEDALFAQVEACAPGFLNLKISVDFLAEYINDMSRDSERLGSEPVLEPQTIMIDYGGPNIAKPLHVGHLRSAIIGESIKRIGAFMGDRCIGDVHLGDWGLQMGLIITELRERQPDLCYFDDAYQGEYPEEAPFTIGELEEIYPTASTKSKQDETYKEAAMEATVRLQQGQRGYQALLRHILNVSVNDLRQNYAKLNVSFELWKGESDAQPYIPGMVEKMKADGFAHLSEGALVVDVREDTDTKEIPPCMILKSDGAALYDTTDLATLVWRMEDYRPDKVYYVVDKRQELHFIQVFRCARKTGIVGEDTELKFIGFGTMNGKDGKPFKTRDGGVMRLEHLLDDINAKMYEKIAQNQTMSEEEAREAAQKVALSAIKYGDLSNQASKDYVFDVDRFTSFEGNTGPYILYTIVRIKSILNKYAQSGGTLTQGCVLPAAGDGEKSLMIELAKFNGAVRNAYEECAPHKICAYIYDLANAFNHFYHDTRIMTEEDEKRRAGYICLLDVTRRVLEKCIDLLGFSAPERM